MLKTYFGTEDLKATKVAFTMESKRKKIVKTKAEIIEIENEYILQKINKIKMIFKLLKVITYSQDWSKEKGLHWKS